MDDTLQKWIEAQAAIGLSAAEIERRMQMEERFVGKATLPSLRTIRRVVSEVRVEDSSGKWGITESEGDDARLILDVLVAVIMATDGKKCTFTTSEANWVLKLRRAAPGAHPYRVWLLARECMRAQAKRLDTAAIDHYLAFRPWASANRWGNYAAAIDEGWIKEDPLGLWDTVDRLGTGLGDIASRLQGDVDSDPRMLTWWREWEKSHPLRLESDDQVKKRLLIVKKQNPELYRAMGTVGKNTRRRVIEWLTAWFKRGDLAFTTEDKKELESMTAEFYKLLRSAGVQQ
ncbi:MAG: hypothetical protein JW753_09295 [Dehalococcoidia bacterium]|nr:hypothetical protein [Dehalococcoidia bacterium]